MGSKYEFKPNSNPGIGTYNTESSLTQPRVKDVSISREERVSYFKSYSELKDGPDPGAYHNNERVLET